MPHPVQNPPDPSILNLPASVPQDERFLEHMLRVWRTDIYNFTEHRLPGLLVTLALILIAAQVVKFFVARLNKRAAGMIGNSRRGAQLRTMAAIVRATSYALLGAWFFIVVIDAIGVPLGPFIASAGVIGLGISFGAQSLFKDMLNGIFILIEDQYSVGDTVRIASLTGTVEDLSLRATRLRDGDGTLYIVPNSQITTVSNLSRDFAVASLALPVDAREKPDHVIDVLKRITQELRHDEAFKEVVIADPDVAGVDKITLTEAVYSVSFRVMVNQRDAVLRDLRRRVLLAFEAEGIHLAPANSTYVVNPDGSLAAATNSSQ